MVIAASVVSVASCQKEGNMESIRTMVLCAISAVLKCFNIQVYFITRTAGVREGGTHSKDGRVVRHGRRLVLLVARRGRDYVQVLHVAAAENNILVEEFRASNLITGTPTLRAVALDILERDRVVLAVYLMQRADVLDVRLGNERDTRSDEFRHRRGRGECEEDAKDVEEGG